MNNSFGLYLAARCGLCDQLIDEERQRQTAFSVRMFGAAAYAVCPVCGLEADPEDPEWRNKVDKFLGTRTQSNWHLASEYPDDIRY